MNRFKIRNSGFTVVAGLFITLAGLTCAHAAEENEPESIVAEAPTVPVAPGQISSIAKGAAKFLQRGQFKDFNARYNNRWKANLNKRDGRVRILYGNLSKRYAGDPRAVARHFLKDAHTVFGMKTDMADLKTLRVAQTARRHHVRFQQTYDGVPVRGAVVLVHTNRDGQVSMVQNDYRQSLRVENRRRITRAAAVKIALDDLERHVGAMGLIAPEKAQVIAVPSGDRHLFVWEITIPTEDPFGYWVYHIDTDSAVIIYKANEIVALTDGEGKTYKNNRAWHKEKIKRVTLKHMFSYAEGLVPGWLFGLHADIYDHNGNDPFSPKLRFNFDPQLPEEKPWFDATSAYYHMNTMWRWWNQKILKKFGPASPEYFYSLAIPVIVNVDDLCNAFYTPELVEGIPGFIFGNEDACGPLSEDLVLDRGVVSHEYTHAMMDWIGFDEQFDGPVDHYGRAMGEGNADWFAHRITKSPLSGDVAWDWSAEGHLRRLDNTRVYPGDVDHPATGMPQEHHTGQIWGGYLYDLNQVLKSNALKFVYQGLFYFTSEGGHRPLQPDFFDAIYAQILAEQDLNGGNYKNAAKAWGAMASRGINAVIRAPYAHASDYFGSGLPGSDAPAYFSWSFPPVKGIKTKGRIFKAFGTNEYPITLTDAGRKLSVAVEAKAAGMAPAVEIYTTDAVFVGAGRSSVNQAFLEIPDIPPGEYVFVVRASKGPYEIEVQVN